jgi:hypothetical protein
MKFFESHYDEYVKEVEEFSLHPEVNELFSTFPTSIHNLQNVILYGPKGVGKYSQSLYLISKYSPSQLKYEKRIAVLYNKETFFVKISDVHFEVDMALLGCNSKHIWNEIYNQIIDIVSSRTNNTAIVMCKNFHKIHSELLETFYSYMHDIEYVNLKFVIITDNVSFIPDNITQRCQIINFKRPTIDAYNKCLFETKPTVTDQYNKRRLNDGSAPTSARPTIFDENILSSTAKYATENIIVKSSGCAAMMYKPTSQISIPHIQTNDIFQVIKKTPICLTEEFNLHNITNIKSLKANITELLVPHENICNSIIQIIKSPTTHLKYDVLRDLLYDLLIYDVDIQECIWFILDKLIQDGVLLREYMDDVMIKMFTFLQYFNNNYRPIYHLENFVLILICKIHGYKHIQPKETNVKLSN